MREVITAKADADSYLLILSLSKDAPCQSSVGDSSETKRNRLSLVQRKRQGIKKTEAASAAARETMEQFLREIFEV
jgi:hypothetical protein